MKYLPEQIDLGVLGGMGPQATQYFVDELLKTVEARRHPLRDQEYPNLLVRYACYLPDRTKSLEKDLEPFTRAFAREVELLLELGCPQIIVPCITAHAVIETRLAHLPVVDIPRMVGAHLQQAHPGARIGVLATRGSHLAGVVDKFTGGTQKAVTLAPQELEDLMTFIYHRAKTWQGHQDVSGIVGFADRLRQRGCDLVVAGCTEIEMCFARCERETPYVVYPLRIVAETFTAQWMERRS